MKLLSFFGLSGAVLSFAAHWVLTGWAVRAFARRWATRPRAIACGVVAVFPMVLRSIALHTHSPFADGLLGAAMLEQMCALVVMVPLLVLRGLSRYARFRAEEKRAAARLAASASPASGEAPPALAEASPGTIDRRSALETLGGVAAMGATGLAFGWGMAVGRHEYEVTEVPVRIPGLPKSLDGYVLVQISDIHAGLFVGERELREGAELIRHARPDAVVATGDLVDFDFRQAPALGRALADLAPRDGVFAILGNHDYYAGHVEVSEAVRAAGISLLVNESRIVRPSDGGGFALVGSDELWAQRYGGSGPNLRVAMASLPRDVPRILLAHHPEEFNFTAGKVALQLSGHTHGGQIRPANLLLHGPVAGRYDRDGSILYVNRGFGVAGPPARIGVPPEITKIVLVAA